MNRIEPKRIISVTFVTARVGSGIIKTRTLEPEGGPILIKKGSVTVRIYSTPDDGRESYTVAWNEAGLRKRITRADLAEAKAEAKDIAERLDGGRGEALPLTGPERDGYQYFVAKLKRLRPAVSFSVAADEYFEAKKFGVPLTAAAKFYKERHHEKLPQKTVEEVKEEFIANKTQDGMSVRYLADCRSRLGRFAEDMRVNIGSIDTNTLDAWLRSLDVKGRSRNNYRGMLMTLFRFARSKGYLPKGQPTAADELQRAKNASADTGIFTPQEFYQLLHADPEKMEGATPKEKLLGQRKFLVPYFVAGGLAGLRHAEIVRLEWPDIDFTQKVVRVGADKSKTASHRIVPLSDAAIAWLEPYRQQDGQICSDRQSKYARQVATKLGIKWPPNSLRHSYGTYRLAQVKSAAQVALEMGNSPKMIFAHYRKPVTEQDATLYFSIAPETPANVIKLKLKLTA